MTVQELIDELQKIKDKDQKIVITTGYREVSDRVYVNIIEDFRYARGANFYRAVKVDLCND